MSSIIICGWFSWNRLLSESRRVLLFLVKFTIYFYSKFGFSPGRKETGVNVISVIDRTRRDLLGTSSYSVGIDSETNRDGKYSNPDLRYPTCFLISNGHAVKILVLPEDWSSSWSHDLWIILKRRFRFFLLFDPNFVSVLESITKIFPTDRSKCSSYSRSITAKSQS